MTEYCVPEFYCEPEFTRTITGKIINRNVLELIFYESGLYQIGPKQKKKRRVMKNDKGRSD